MRLSYKYKGIAYLCLLLIILPWLVGSYALSGTISSWIDCQKLEKEYKQLQAANLKGSTLKNFSDNMLLDGKLLTELQPTAEQWQVVIGDYRPLVTACSEDIEVHTAAIILEGTFADMLHVIQHIEHNITPCKISSLHFTSEISQGKDKQRLEVTLYVEQIVQSRK